MRWRTEALACLCIGEHAHADEVWSASNGNVKTKYADVQELETAAELLHLRIMNSSRYARLNDAEAPADARGACDMARTRYTDG